MSGHEGRTLKTLDFGECNVERRSDGAYCWTGVKETSLALVAALRDGLFPNLEELSTPSGALFEEVPELAEVMRRGAPCARTLVKVVISGLLRVNLDALRAALPRATVLLA